MPHDAPRDVADLLASLRETDERRTSERNPQTPVNLLRTLTETVAVDDTVTAEVRPAADAKMDWSADSEWGFSEW